ncbi:hypothetical protein GLOIN_2v1680273 [Rhizophagus irregularis DAOM 181602=DAOM 197198]|uniref:Uncharacterized protein n=1 Tax=Rhizophagus irregularis (strain DAOM 181602 / DAOM 197198 / MUCL 43194) TaxID=747089 RepID=A0A2P4PF77_RHIID|nr:hypothetical protein GLOIN_2v1680273 [Rhizophagus irregularis DAOM 181602=DAOM 197198]POG64044.1 hypothetical protein GLOIN_2v1680273 [Rhizophagus irregularis DAOM 181602=DAOM 197198]|eukprot:XP_025170910.1 hypothetical protein GLOIN_2v1680273 [Rhizophagus irregularis DAOM 181602=DAOM 197198]
MMFLLSTIRKDDQKRKKFIFLISWITSVFSLVLDKYLLIFTFFYYLHHYIFFSFSQYRTKVICPYAKKFVSIFQPRKN